MCGITGIFPTGKTVLKMYRECTYSRENIEFYGGKSIADVRDQIDRLAEDLRGVILSNHLWLGPSQTN